MKKILGGFLLALICIFCMAQVTRQPRLIYLQDVKQGTTWTEGQVPSYNATTLQFSNATISGGSGSGIPYHNGTGTNLTATYSNATDVALWVKAQSTAPNTNLLQVSTTASTAMDFVVRSNRFVGIQTNIPIAALHVNGAALIESGLTNIGATVLKGPRANTIVGNVGGTVDVTKTNTVQLATNASFALTFSGSPLDGQLLTLIVSNTSVSADIYMTNIAGIYNESARTNANLFLIASNSVSTFDFRYRDGSWNWKGDGGFSWSLSAGTGITSSTNGPAGTVTWNVASSMWFTNGNFITLTNSSAILDIFDWLIPAGTMPTNGMLEIVADGKHINNGIAFTPTNYIYVGGTLVLSWTTASLSTQTQWRDVKTQIRLINKDATTAQALTVFQTYTTASMNTPTWGVSNATAFISIASCGTEINFDTSTNLQIRFSMGLTNGTTSYISFPPKGQVIK